MATPHVTATKSNLERWPAASSSSCKCVLRHQAQGEQKKGDDDDDDDDDLMKGYRVREQPSEQGTWQSSWKLPQTETWRHSTGYRTTPYQGLQIPNPTPSKKSKSVSFSHSTKVHTLLLHTILHLGGGGNQSHLSAAALYDNKTKMSSKGRHQSINHCKTIKRRKNRQQIYVQQHV
jgi:hypothetical protein